ncbi:hypothetical protein K1719_000241 [Acacia pycnantha]|nr:hypothetical protein K1719_000241 [Acacia pycnantha]
MCLTVCDAQHLSYCCQKHYLFAKVLGSSHMHSSKLHMLINLHWSLRYDVRVIQQCANHFVLHFSNAMDKSMVLSQGDDFSLHCLPMKRWLLLMCTKLLSRHRRIEENPNGHARGEVNAREDRGEYVLADLEQLPLLGSFEPSAKKARTLVS